MVRSRPSAADARAFREVVRGLVPANAKYVVSVFYFWRDEPGDEGSRLVEKLGPKGLVNRAVSGYRQEGDTCFDPAPKDLAGVLHWVSMHYEGDGTYCVASVMTLTEYNRQEEERERAACERLASEIVRRYKVKPNSLAFVAAVHRHYGNIADRERHFRTDPERRMERYGAAMMNGSTASFWEDNNYSSSLESRARDEEARLNRYLHRYCPLLMARWEERQARRRERREKK